MKSLTGIILWIILSTSCIAQQPVTKLVNDRVKINNTSYILIKPDNKVTQIINANNKLNNVKQVAPNMPSDLKLPGYRKFDKNLLIKICAEVIPLSTLQKLPKGINDHLYIYIKINTKGDPLEMDFLVKNNSLITPNEIQQIEDKIMKSPFKVTFTHGIERYFEGVNYFDIDVWINYNDILKVKEAK